MPDGLQQLIIARAETGIRPKTRIIAEDVYLMLLPPGYELTNKLKINSSLLPSHGELSVLYIDDPKQTSELLELVRLRAASPLVNSIPPTRRTRPLPPHNENPENIKFIGEVLGEEEDAQASQYRHVMGRIHEVIGAGLLKFVSSEPSDENKIKVLPYLQNLGHASPVWEERAKKLLIEEQQVLQQIIKEIRGGWLFLHHFLSSNCITAADWERLVVTAMAETVRKSPILRDYHMVAYDVGIDHFVHGKVGETLLLQLDAWKCPPNAIDSDSFRINSPFMTGRKHPMQRLDELGEKFFRKLTNTYQSGETLYTRAVLCRSLLITYFFQSFVSVWDDCLLNGHLQGLKGLVPAYPKIIDRLRDYMARGSCPRESHPEFRHMAKQSTQGEDESTAMIPVIKIVPPQPCFPSVVETPVSKDIEMVDAGPLSDNSSDTIIQEEELAPPAPVSKEDQKLEKRKFRRDKRRQIRRAAMGIEEIQNEPTGEEKLLTSISEALLDHGVFDAASALPKTVDENSELETAAPETALNLQIRSLLDDLSIKKKDSKTKPKPIANVFKVSPEKSSEEVEKLVLSGTSLGGPNNAKNKAKKERRRAKAANLVALQQIEHTSAGEEQDLGIIPPATEDGVLGTSPVPKKQSKKKKKRVSKEEKSEPSQQAEELKLSDTSVLSQSLEKLPESVLQDTEDTMPRRRKSLPTTTVNTVPGAVFVQAQSESANNSQATTPSKPDTDLLYDDPEAIAAGIKASEEEESSWTKVGSKKNDNFKGGKFMNTIQTRGSGHNAVFPNKNIHSRPPPHKPHSKPPMVQAKVAPTQNQGSPKPGVSSATAPGKKPLSKENQKPLPKENQKSLPKDSQKQLPKENQKQSGKNSRQKREARLPAFDSMKEFPTLAASTKLLSRSKDAQSTGEPSVDMNVELASQGIESLAAPETTAESAVGDAKASDQGSLKQKVQSVSVASPPHPAVLTKAHSNEPSIVAEVVQAKKNTTTPQSSTESVIEPLATKGQVQNTQANVSMTEQKSEPTLSTSSSPLAETSYKGTPIVAKDQTPVRALTKKERRALAKKVPEDQKTPKLSIKERAELRRSLESKKSPESVGKTKGGSDAAVVTPEEVSLIESPGIAHPGTQTVSPVITHTGSLPQSPAIVHAGKPAVSSENPAITDGGISTGSTQSPGIVHPGISVSSTTSPGITHPGTSKEASVETSPEPTIVRPAEGSGAVTGSAEDVATNSREGLGSEVIGLPAEPPRPKEVRIASGVSNGKRYNIVAYGAAAKVLSGRNTTTPKVSKSQQNEPVPATNSQPRSAQAEQVRRPATVPMFVDSRNRLPNNLGRAG
ncbi:hypothetical protein TWF281_009570 [Arthrobotrys megalospora]